VATVTSRGWQCWFRPLRNAEEAHQITRDVAGFILLVAILRVILGLAYGNWAPAFEGLIWVILGISIRRWRSRVAAILLTLLAGMALFLGGPTLIYLMLLWAGGRSVEATLRLPSLAATEGPTE
jgi:hypothetical protein